MKIDWLTMMASDVKRLYNNMKQDMWIPVADAATDGNVIYWYLYIFTGKNHNTIVLAVCRFQTHHV